MQIPIQLQYCMNFMIGSSQFSYLARLICISTVSYMIFRFTSFSSLQVLLNRCCKYFRSPRAVSSSCLKSSSLSKGRTLPLTLLTLKAWTTFSSKSFFLKNWHTSSTVQCSIASRYSWLHTLFTILSFTSEKSRSKLLIYSRASPAPVSESIICISALRNGN